VVALERIGAIINASQQGTQTMFKYTVHAKLNTPRRGVSLTIKTEIDWDVSDKVGMDGFLAAHHVVTAAEKVFGEGTVQECVMTEKTQMISCA
jgi:hypothetical protein